MGEYTRRKTERTQHKALLVAELRQHLVFGMASTIEENEKAAFLSSDRLGGQVNVGSKPDAKLEKQKNVALVGQRQRSVAALVLAS